MTDYPSHRVASPDIYSYDTDSMAAHVAGITVLPNIVDRWAGWRDWDDWNVVKDRAAVRHAHCIVGCLDAPMDDLVGTG